MSRGFVVKQSIAINAPVAKVWDALVNPEMIKQYMFGTNVVTDWKVGSPIVFKGEWEGKTYEEKGVILRLEPKRLIEYTYFSSLSEFPDTPENYHTITVELSNRETHVFLSISQDNNRTREAQEHSEKNWGMVLGSLKKLLEQ
jgi:uncharacterized protein YndB with AHSA1/START domain